ncbi:MAG: tetratricopeptide repeat protein, partial [Deltaproteobacteria bacterium]
GLCHFYQWRGRYQEGEAVCQAAVKKLASMVSGSGLRGLAKILTWQSRFSQILDRTESASQLLQQSLALLDSPELADQDTRPEKAFILLEMGHRAVDSDNEKARQLAEQSLALYRELDDHWGTADALDVLTEIAWTLGTYDEARQLAEEGFALRQTLGDQRGIARSLRSLGDVANFHMGQLEEGETLITQALAIRQEIGDRAGMANDLHELATNLAYRGKFAESLAMYEKSVALRADLGLGGGYASIVINNVKVFLGWYEQAGDDARTRLDVAREIEHQQEIGLSLFVLGNVALAGEAYAEAQDFLQESVAVYREMGHRMRLGMALASLGYAARRLGRFSQARQHLSESLRTAVELGAFVPLMFALPAIALLLTDRGEQERAVELYALATRYGFVANSCWFEDVAGKHIATVAATLSPEVVAAVQERGKARDLWETAAELLAKLEPKHNSGSSE